MSDTQESFEISCGQLVRYTGTDRVIFIPEGVRYIGDGAFYGNTDLEKVILPRSLRHIGRSAFAECYNLKQVEFNRELEVVGESVFEGCRGLQEVYLHDRVGFIGRMAFAKCTSLKSVRLPERLSELKQGLFMGDASLEHVELPKQLDTIGDSVFYYCKSLKEIEMSPYVRMITPNTFYGCSGLKRGYIPGMNLNYYPLEEQLMLAMLYLTTKQRYSAWEQQVYDTLISQCKDLMCKKILEAKSYEAIEEFLNMSLLDSEDMDRWIGAARKDGDLEFTARLLQWKQKIFEHDTDMWEI